MASTKITELNSANAAASTDLLLIVADPSGSPTTKKISVNNFTTSQMSSVKTDIIPSGNNTLNLGSPAKGWKNIYVSTLLANGDPGQPGDVLVSDGANTYWSSDTLQLVSAPANSSSSGVRNQVAWDSNFFYICVGANTWKRIALQSF